MNEITDIQKIIKEDKTIYYDISIYKTELEKLKEEKICKENEKYRSVLEEINRTLLGVRGLSIHCDKQIIKVRAIVNEVLNA